MRLDRCLRLLEKVDGQKEGQNEVVDVLEVAIGHLDGSGSLKLVFRCFNP